MSKCDAGIEMRRDEKCPKCGAGPEGPCWEGFRRDQEELKRLREFAGWVDSWVSNPVGTYSVSALDGLFGMTRDKIATLPSPHSEGGNA